MPRIRIHRDHTFEYDGEAYCCARQGPRGGGDDAYEVHRVSDGRTIDDGVFYSLAEIRSHVALCQAHGWPLIGE